MKTRAAVETQLQKPAKQPAYEVDAELSGDDVLSGSGDDKYVIVELD